jgi:ABC-type sugar transport system substrate-binding protein
MLFFIGMCGAAIALAACGSSSGGGSSSESSTTTSSASTNESSPPSSAVVSEAKTEVKALEDLSGQEWKLPTESFDPGKHKVALIDISLSDPGGKLDADGWLAAVKAMGWEYKLFNAEFSTPKMAGYISQATQEGYEAIIWDANDANTMKAPIEAALEAGIPMSCTGCHTVGFPKIQDASATWPGQGEAVADWIIAEQNAEAKVLAMVDEEFPTVAAIFEGFDSKMETACPSCELSRTNYTVAELAKPGPPSWKAALTEHPSGSLTDVVASYDAGAVPFVKTAEQEGREDFAMSSFELAPEFAALMAEGKENIGVDTAVDQELNGWASLDQVARQVAGLMPWNSHEFPFVLVSKNNISEIKEGRYNPPDFDYAAAFEKVWEKG